MSYATKAILRDVNDDPIPQGYDDGGDVYKELAVNGDGRQEIIVYAAIPAGDNNIGNMDLVGGQAAHDAAIAGNPVRIGGRAVNANLTPVSNGDTTDGIYTLTGAQVVVLNNVPEMRWSYAAANGGIVNTGDVTLRAAPGSGLKTYLTRFDVQNVSPAVETEFIISPSGGSPIYRAYLPVNMAKPLIINVSEAVGITANTALVCACVTTGAQVYINANGFIAP